MTLPSRFVPLYSADNWEAEGPFLPDAPALVKEKTSVALVSTAGMTTAFEALLSKRATPVASKNFA